MAFLMHAINPHLFIQPPSALTGTLVIFAKFFDVWGQRIRRYRKFYVLE